jgi:carbon-monoxide dehydrogenase catalytic subunit
MNEEPLGPGSRPAPEAPGPSGRVRSIDPATTDLLSFADCEAVPTMFSRAEALRPCPIGAEGACCRICFMGPCRFTGANKDEATGVCGATLATVAARNFLRACAGGASAHADHGRGIAHTLLAVARGEAGDYRMKDQGKLRRLAVDLGVAADEAEAEARDQRELAEAVALAALHEFGRQEGHQTLVSRAPARRRALWERWGVTPRGFDREVVEAMHRTHAGTDQDAEHLLDHAVRMCLADGWGGSMLATDLSDVLFGTPRPLASEANLGVLSPDEVNIIIHGHEPTLSELIVDAAQEPEMLEYARSRGAQGINLAGICCTANEIWMRRGVPPAGNMLHQELAVLTGAVELMVVDVQCFFQGLVDVAGRFHTHIVTTSPKARITGATHMEFREEKALETARAIVRMAVDNYPNRGSVRIPEQREGVVAGFSHEYIRSMLGGRFREGLRPLNDNIANGRIRGVAAIVGCNNARVTQDEGIVNLVKGFIARDVLVVVTGCAAHAAGKHGYLNPETFALAGTGLAEVCETVGMPPVLHMGSCVDNSRILTLLADVVATGGLGDDIDQLPAVGISPEYYCEKAVDIATYCVGSGVHVIFGGVDSPVRASGVVTGLITEGWEKRYGGRLDFIPAWPEILEAALASIERKRVALGLEDGGERVLFDMAARRSL